MSSGIDNIYGPRNVIQQWHGIIHMLEQEFFGFWIKCFSKTCRLSEHSSKIWLAIISGCNPDLKLWLAITSDSNPFFKMGKTRRQKDGCSFYRVKFTWAWITLYPCFLDLMYASVHYFMIKKISLLFIAKYFLFYDFSKKYLCKTWWYHEILSKNQIESKFW